MDGHAAAGQKLVVKWSQSENVLWKAAVRGRGHGSPTVVCEVSQGTGTLRLSLRLSSVRVTDELHFGAMLLWTEMNFSQFAFDLIAIMQGTYEVGRLSTFHGIGTCDWDP
jgi:hypothetical protein